jgi:hypothetical protein
MVPSNNPKQLALVEVVDTATAVGCEIVIDVEEVQPKVVPLASLTVTEYVPATRPLMSSVVAPLLHK